MSGGPFSLCMAPGSLSGRGAPRADGRRERLKRPARSRKFTLLSLALLATVAAALGMAFGGPGIALAVVLAILWRIWRFDNESGTDLVLAVLLLIALAVPALLLLLMAVTH